MQGDQLRTADQATVRGRHHTRHTRYNRARPVTKHNFITNMLSRRHQRNQNRAARRHYNRTMHRKGPNSPRLCQRSFNRNNGRHTIMRTMSRQRPRRRRRRIRRAQDISRMHRHQVDHNRNRRHRNSRRQAPTSTIKRHTTGQRPRGIQGPRRRHRRRHVNNTRIRRNFTRNQHMRNSRMGHNNNRNSRRRPNGRGRPVLHRHTGRFTRT